MTSSRKKLYLTYRDEIMSESNEQKEKKALFDIFPASSRQEWRELVDQDISGSDFEKKLVWKTDEGFSVQPAYFRDDMQGIEHADFHPGEAPFVRSTSILHDKSQPWRITQYTDTSSPERANEEIRKGVKNGQTGVALCCDMTARHLFAGPDALAWKGNEGLAIHELKDMLAVLRDIPVKDIAVEIHAGLSSPVLLAMSFAADVPITHSNFDPFSYLVQHGSLPFSMDRAMHLAAESIKYNERNNGKATVLSVSGECFHDGGANIVQELAFTLSAGVEYLARLQKFGINVDDVARSLRFTFPVGTNFFMEIAKLRAARMLWAKILYHFEVDEEHSLAMRIHARTSRWYQSVYDPWVNMLRGTVESMAAAIGGADSQYTAAFDEFAGDTGEMAKRVARNVQIILQEEAQLKQVMDPAAGSYYVETLTQAIAKESWTLFREVERHGGFLQALREGFIQDGVLNMAENKRRRISTRREILIGTNQYPRIGEKRLPARIDTGMPSNTMPVEFETTLPSIEPDSECVLDNIERAFRNGETLGTVNRALRSTPTDRVRRIPAFRAAERFEHIRMIVEGCERRPKVFLATYGPAFHRRARATFASGFFGVAGMDIIDNPGFDTAEEAAEAALAAQTDILVACSDDESYPALLPRLINAVKNRGGSMLFVVAGYPKDAIETLQVAGVEDFVHVRSDVGATLTHFLEKLGLHKQR